MLKIKLARFGKKNQPHYRIVVNEARSKRDGEYIALLGNYAPAENPKTLFIDMKEYAEWLKNGAQPTDTVASLAKRFESGNPFPKKINSLSKKAKAKLVAEKNKVNDETKESNLDHKAAEPVVETKTETEVAAEPVVETKTDVETK